MKLAAKGNDITHQEKKRIDLFNKEAKRLENTAKIHLPTNLQDQLETALDKINAFSPDRESGGFVNRQIIKAEHIVGCLENIAEKYHRSKGYTKL